MSDKSSAYKVLLSSKQKFDIELINLQFKSGIDVYEDERIPTVLCLKKSSKDYVGEKNIPIIKEAFDYLGSHNYEYFCFTNNDIIISDRYFKFINNTDYDCYPACRLAIQPIKTLNDPIVGSHYQCVGFDTFAIKTKWWKDNSYRFSDYIMGQPEWDVSYATIMRVHGNTFLVNDWPPSIFHIIHEAPWTTTESKSVENQWNRKLFFTNDKKYYDLWWKYVYQVPLTRGDNYWYPHDNEKQIEEKYFKL